MRRRPHIECSFNGRDPDTGAYRCCWCGLLLTGRRTSWCSDWCVQTYLIAKGDQNAARRFLWKRDLGVCSSCRTDTVLPQHIEELRAYGYLGRPPAPPARDFVDGVVRNLTMHEALARLGPSRVGAKWDADHLVPIAEGGQLVRENLRTLCRPCHRRETKALAGRLAARRREGAA